jgi:Cytochrome c7 and related cytochrome c
MVDVTEHPWLLATLAFSVLGVSCGSPPAQKSPENETAAPAVTLGKRRVDLPDDCEVQAGKPPPEPLRISYTGVAKAARCQRAVYTIMGGLSHFLGVECRHCHQEPDYAADTHNKQIANWMARELVPRLQKRVVTDGGRDVWCQDCHAGKPKLLGDPRRRDVAIEWMTTHLVEDFDTAAGKPPKCKDCHGGDLGSPEFRSKIILSELSGLPTPVVPAAPNASAAPVAPAETPPAVAPAPSATPLPDFGQR